MIVFDFDTGASIHHVTGDGVEALRLISGGLDDGDLPEHLRSSVDELIDAGVVEASSSVSRRKALSLGAKGLVAGGAVWGAATVTTFALADPAAPIIRRPTLRPRSTPRTPPTPPGGALPRFRSAHGVAVVAVAVGATMALGAPAQVGVAAHTLTRLP